MTRSQPKTVKLRNPGTMDLTPGDLITMPDKRHGTILKVSKRTMEVQPLRNTAEKTLWKRR